MAHNAACDEASLQQLVTEHVPAETISLKIDAAEGGDGGWITPTSKSLISWIRREFVVAKANETRRRSSIFSPAPSSHMATLRSVLEKTRCGSELELCQILVTACRCLGIPARLVGALSARESEEDVWVEIAMTMTSSHHHHHTWYRVFVSASAASRARSPPSSAAASFPLPQCKPARLCGPDVPFVIAWDVGNRSRDVTMRYASDWIKTTRHRTRALRRAIRSLLSRVGRDEDAPEDEEKDEETRAMQEDLKAVCTTIPVARADFRSHPVYALASALRSREALANDARPVGRFRGEPVYRREDVIEVKTDSAWRRQNGRQVRRECLDSPVKRRGTSTSSSSAASQGTRSLYSLSQTEPYDPGELDRRTGRVPTNDYGNVEILRPEFVPRGCEHVKAEEGVYGTEALVEACRELGIHFAPAAVGFRRVRGKKSAETVVDGVVVAQSNAKAVRSSAWAKVAAQFEAAEREAERRRAAREEVGELPVVVKRVRAD